MFCVGHQWRPAWIFCLLSKRFLVFFYFWVFERFIRFLITKKNSEFKPTDSGSNRNRKLVGVFHFKNYFFCWKKIEKLRLLSSLGEEIHSLTAADDKSVKFSWDSLSLQAALFQSITQNSNFSTINAGKKKLVDFLRLGNKICRFTPFLFPFYNLSSPFFANLKPDIRQLCFARRDANFRLRKVRWKFLESSRKIGFVSVDFFL